MKVQLVLRKKRRILTKVSTAFLISTRAFSSETYRKAEGEFNVKKKIKMNCDFKRVKLTFSSISAK
jgi:hypothetical protein